MRDVGASLANVGCKILQIFHGYFSVGLMIRGLVWLKKISTSRDLGLLEFFLLLAEIGRANCVGYFFAAKRSRLAFTELSAFSFF